jgi:hypothetical protein
MGDVQLFRVTMDDRACEVWAAATSSEEAFGRILDAVPEGWSAALLDKTLTTSREREDLKLQAGEVRKLR